MNTKTINTYLETVKKSPVELFAVILMIVAFVAFVTPSAQAVVDQEVEQFSDNSALIGLEIDVLKNKLKDYGQLPEAESAPALYAKSMYVTAYNSVPWQTDATPCIGAQGTDICDIYAAGENVCAANFVPLGTVIEVEGLGHCTVRDRMNARYYYRVDWYMGMDIDGAKQFGIQNKTVHVYNS